MNMKELVKEATKRSTLTQKEIREALDSILEVITETLSRGEKVEIRGFGSFFMKERKGRIARNPKTNEPLELPPMLVPHFKAGKQLKEKTVKLLEPPKKKRRKRGTSRKKTRQKTV